MPTPNIKKIYATTIPLIRFLFGLLVNGFTFFGIIVWKWNFFTIIYLYWFEEVIRIIFRLVENKINYKKNKISKSESKLQHKATLAMFFPMFVYFVFIIIIVGMIAAPNTDVVLDNLFTVFFRNTEFNLNLLLAVVSEIAILVYLVRKYNQNKFDNQSKITIQEELEKEFLRKQQEEEAKRYKNLYQKDMAQNQNQLFSTQMIVLHLSIILGTFLYFAANTDKLPIQINLGAAGEFAFVIVFAAVQTIGEVLAFVKGRK